MQYRLQALQAKIGYTFRQPELLQQALTHRSFGLQHNERLEFMGDAMLNLAVSRLLWDRFAVSDEGELTRMRAHLVREDTLHRVALEAGFPPALRMSEGEAKGGGAQRPSILADALEAVVGAVYFDGGYESAQAVVERLFSDLIANTSLDTWRKDPKTELQEWLQARRIPVPSYRILATHGQAHAQTFEVLCEIAVCDVATTGVGRSRRAAEQEAARLALSRVQSLPPHRLKMSSS